MYILVLAPQLESASGSDCLEVIEVFLYFDIISV